MFDEHEGQTVVSVLRSRHLFIARRQTKHFNQREALGLDTVWKGNGSKLNYDTPFFHLRLYFEAKLKWPSLAFRACPVL